MIDPFLMCDEFGPTVSKGLETDPDKFGVDWHPHVGMDICTYLREGTGRHADSMGNRGTFASPGFQWISVGSGIEHAEGGGTPRGQRMHGFQLWVNVPRAKKRDDPRYGTADPGSLPNVALGDGGGGGGAGNASARVRVLAGPVAGAVGPFKTAQPVQIADYELEPGARATHTVPPNMQTCLVYVYRGSLTVGGRALPEKSIALLDATDAEGARAAPMRAGAGGAGALVFAGARIGEPICWHGPFVLASRAALQRAFGEYQAGTLPSVRVPWDYRRAAARPTSGGGGAGHG